MNRIKFDRSGESRGFTTVDGDEFFFRFTSDEAGNSDKGLCYVADFETGEPIFSTTGEYVYFSSLATAEFFLNNIAAGMEA